jgi:hypothetical protein
MKKICLFLFVLFSFTINSFGQTYSFSKLVKKATVQTSNGNEQRIIGTYQGPYRFVFETPSDPSIKRLFTLLSPGQSNGPGLPWYGLLKEMGYIEKDGLLMKKYLYANTGARENEMVIIAEDYSLIVIFKNDDTIFEYYR